MSGMYHKASALVISVAVPYYFLINEFNEKEFLDSSLMEDFSRAATDPCLEAAVEKAREHSQYSVTSSDNSQTKKL